MKLIAFLGEDKSYGQISALANRMESEKTILVRDSKTENPFSGENFASVTVDSSKDIVSFKKEIQEKLKPHLKEDFEVALTLASGNGKEHMALLSALLNIPVGVKVVVYTREGIEFLT